MLYVIIRARRCLVPKVRARQVSKGQHILSYAAEIIELPRSRFLPCREGDASDVRDPLLYLTDDFACT